MALCVPRPVGPFPAIASRVSFVTLPSPSLFWCGVPSLSCHCILRSFPGVTCPMSSLSQKARQLSKLKSNYRVNKGTCLIRFTGFSFNQEAISWNTMKLFLFKVGMSRTTFGPDEPLLKNFFPLRKAVAVQYRSVVKLDPPCCLRCHQIFTMSTGPDPPGRERTGCVHGRIQGLIDRALRSQRSL